MLFPELTGDEYGDQKIAVDRSLSIRQLSSDRLDSWTYSAKVMSPSSQLIRRLGGIVSARETRSSVEANELVKQSLQFTMKNIVHPLQYLRPK